MLFTFPSRYLFTIGLRRVFSLGGWARRIHTGFLVTRATQDTGRLQSAAGTGLSPSADRLSRLFPSPRSCHHPVLQPRERLDAPGLGCSPFARHYLGNHVLFSLPAGTKMFQFPALAPAHTKVRVSGRQPDGLPHSDTRGSQVACTYPRIFAACRVFRRLPEPRHPPYALFCFRRPCPHKGGAPACKLESAQDAPQDACARILFSTVVCSVP